MITPTTGNLIPLLVQLLIGGLIVYAIYWFVDLLKIPSPFNTMVKVIIAIIALIWLLRIFGIAV